MVFPRSKLCGRRMLVAALPAFHKGISCSGGGLRPLHCLPANGMVEDVPAMRMLRLGFRCELEPELPHAVPTFIKHGVCMLFGLRRWNSAGSSARYTAVAAGRLFSVRAQSIKDGRGQCYWRLQICLGTTKHVAMLRARFLCARTLNFLTDHSVFSSFDLGDQARLLRQEDCFIHTDLGRTGAEDAWCLGSVEGSNLQGSNVLCVPCVAAAPLWPF